MGVVGGGGGGRGGGWERLVVKWHLIEESHAPMKMKFEISMSAMSREDASVRICRSQTESVLPVCKQIEALLCSDIHLGRSIRALADRIAAQNPPRPQKAQTRMLRQMQAYKAALDKKIAGLAQTVMELRELKTDAEKDMQSKCVLSSCSLVSTLFPLQDSRLCLFSRHLPGGRFRNYVDACRLREKCRFYSYWSRASSLLCQSCALRLTPSIAAAGKRATGSRSSHSR